MIPLAIPNLSGREREYLSQCIDTGFVSSVGEFVNRIEKEAAEATGAVGAVATSAGTTALQTALLSLGVEPGDLVIVPSFTFIASANSVSHCHARPWFFDVDEESWTLIRLWSNELFQRSARSARMGYSIKRQISVSLP